MKHILDQKFVYYRAVDTDLKRTFARVRVEQERLKELTGAKVAEIKPKIRGKANV